MKNDSLQLDIPERGPKDWEDAASAPAIRPQWLDRFAPPRMAVPFLIAFGIVIILVNLGAYPTYTKGEPREAIRILDIVRGGGWILPTQQGIGLPWKPPLMYWLGALVSIALGTVNEWTVRLPSGLLGVGGIVCCYLYVRKLFDERSALLAALILATSLQYQQAATAARVDMTLTFCMEVAFFEFILIAEGLTRRRMLLYAALAAAVLAKGPIGAVLPALIMLIWIAVERRWSLLHELKIFRGALLILVLAGGWYAAATVSGGMAFIRRQILAENLYRLFPNHAFHEPHAHPFYFVELALLAGYLPWTGLIPLGIVALRNGKRVWNPRTKYLVIWVVSVLVFYNLPRSKRGIYLLALYPALATLTALMLNVVRARAAEWPRMTRLTALAAGMVFGATALGTLAWQGAIWLSGAPFLASLMERFGVRTPELAIQLSHAINRLPLIAVVLPVVTCVAAAYLVLAEPTADRIFTAFLVAISCSILVAHLFVVPAIARTLTLKHFARESMKIADGRTVGDLGSTDFDVDFYAGRDITRASPDHLQKVEYLICWEGYYGLLSPRLRHQLAVVMISSPTSLNGRGRMLLLRNSAVSADDSFRPETLGTRAVMRPPAARGPGHS